MKRQQQRVSLLEMTRPIRAIMTKNPPPRIQPPPGNRPVPNDPRAIPRPPQSSNARPNLPRRAPRKTFKLRWWMVAAAFVALMVSACGTLALGVGVIYANGILPGVNVAGIKLGGLSQDEAEAKLRNRWGLIMLEDGDRSWPINPAQMGIYLDTQRTAEAAYKQGRGEGNMFAAILSDAEVVPVVAVDSEVAQAALNDLVAQVELAPVNAGVQLIDGHVQATPPVNGRTLDIFGTLARLQNAPEVLADGKLELVMFTVEPAVTDASAMVAEAERLLSSFFDVRLYDPKTGDSVYWSLPPQQWAAWLSATPDPTSASGLSLAVTAGPVRDFLSAQADSMLDSTRYIQVDEGVTSVQQAVAAGQTSAYLRVYHHDLQHIVQAGDTIVSLAWDYGVPYPWIQNANPGVDSLTIGQTVTIPSVDNFLPYPPNPDKRIVVSISQQRAWIYENGELKWEWTISTGIQSSPTWPGIYQILSHEINAYAGNWNLWMPNFMGVYKPIPGSDFTNGFHGFPTRGGGQLLWENNLGTRVTYGCILLSNTNAEKLYNWAEEGVVVEIQA